jgi:hypothetical protein
MSKRNVYHPFFHEELVIYSRCVCSTWTWAVVFHTGLTLSRDKFPRHLLYRTVMGGGKLTLIDSKVEIVL